MCAERPDKRHFDAGAEIKAGGFYGIPILSALSSVGRGVYNHGMLMYELSQVNSDVPTAEGISPRLASLLYARGARDREAMELFLHPGEGQFLDPLLMKDMDKALKRIKQAIGREKICVYGDYDADGVCATSILFDCLKRLGADVMYDIPSRHDEGYGLNLSAVERLAENGVQLIITVDNGVKAYGEIDRCSELGIGVVVTDHHRCDGKIPDCCAVVCHTREDDTYPNGDICGAGIAWKLAEGLIGRDEARRYLPQAGIATMADVVPLLGENRAIVAVALSMINRGECCEGIKALGHIVNEKGDSYTSRDLSFGFGPRLNAAGRMEDASICVELLCTEDAKKAAEAAELLNELNRRRQAEEGGIVDSAARMVEDMDLTRGRSIVLSSPDWNPGVIGIAAARIAERYYRPTLLFSEKDGVLTGSARSVPGVDLYKALNANNRFFTRFGGHAYAAGVTMPSECLEEFRASLDDTFRSTVADELFIPRRSYEAEIELSELTLPMVEELELLAPFGEGNPEPAFRTDGMLLRGIKRVGSAENHIKATAVKDDRYVDLIAFSQGHRFRELADMGRCDAIYTPTVNQWNGMRSVQLRVRDMRPAPIEEPKAFMEERRDKFLDAFSRNILYNTGHGINPEMDEAESIALALSGSIAGTMILCFTPGGAAELIAELTESGLFRRLDAVFGANRPFPCGYHTAVFAPVIDELKLSRFHRVFMYDSSDAGIAGRLSALAPGVEVVPGKSCPLDEFASLVPDRSLVAACYKAIRSSERMFFNREELIDYLASVAKVPVYMARLGERVIEELNFIDTSDGIRLVKNPPQRDLMESETYAAAHRLLFVE